MKNIKRINIQISILIAIIVITISLVRTSNAHKNLRPVKLTFCEKMIVNRELRNVFIIPANGDSIKLRTCMELRNCKVIIKPEIVRVLIEYDEYYSIMSVDCGEFGGASELEFCFEDKKSVNNQINTSYTISDGYNIISGFSEKKFK